MHGHFMLGEAASVTNETSTLASVQGQAAIASLARRCFPKLGNLKILRGWAAPVAFTADALPFWGLARGIDGLILATAFKTTVIITPLVGDIVAQLVKTGRSPVDLTPFSPDRNIANGH
jgi:sarcosine oxidase subunit beta